MKNSNHFIFKTGVCLTLLTLIMLPSLASAEITSSLRVGSRNTDVTELQTFLASDTTLYPQGLITGYFGSMTKAAVIRFQGRNGLTADGIVGPRTRAMINAQLGGVSDTAAARIISNISVVPSRTSAVVNWSTNGAAQGMVYYSPTPLTTYEYENAVTVSGLTAMTDTTARPTQSVSITNLQPNTTYHYLIYVTGQNGMVSVTWPATFTTSN